MENEMPHMMMPDSSRQDRLVGMSAGQHTEVDDSTIRVNDNPNLQKQAIDSACTSFSLLTTKYANFQQCIFDKESITEVVKAVEEKYWSHRRKRSTRILEAFQRHTIWLQSISDVVDTVVQIQAGIACPLWAPLKFVLKMSKDHSEATQTILEVIQIISEGLPRFDIYQKLKLEPELQVALLNIFTDIVDFSVQALQHFGQAMLMRLAKTILDPFKEQFAMIVARIKRHAKLVDSTATAIEMHRNAIFRKESADKDQRNLMTQFQGWLRAPNMRAIQEVQTQIKLRGTCEWVWSNPTFVSWNNARGPMGADRLLCIHGTHGCGKTILASSMAEGLSKDSKKTVFFSFSGTDSGRQSFESLLRSFVSQLSHDTKDKVVFDGIQALMLRGQPLVTELWNTFKSIVEVITVPIYCIIDGLDECSDPIKVILDHILELLSLNINCKAILLGRSHSFHAVSSAMPCTIQIIPELIRRDMNAYIDAETGKYDILNIPEMEGTISRILQEKSDGMFLWVKLMIDDLGKSESQSQVLQRIRDLPRGLEEAYRLLFCRLLGQLDKYDLVLVINILTFITAACRPLDVEEIRHAHALNSGLSTSSFKDRLLMQPEKRILTVCGGLIKISNGFFRLIHLSLKEFLTRPEDEWLNCDDLRIRSFRVGLEASNLSFSSICLNYLQMCDYSSPLQDADDYANLKIRYPFLSYSSRYLHQHLSLSGINSGATIDQFGNLFKSWAGPCWVECLGMGVLESEESWDTIFLEVITFQTWLSRLEGDDNCWNVLWIEFLKGLREKLENGIQDLNQEDPRTETWQHLLDFLLGYVFEVEAGNPEKDISGISPSDTPPSTIGSSSIQMINPPETSHSGLQIVSQVRDSIIHSSVSGTEQIKSSLRSTFPPARTLKALRSNSILDLGNEVDIILWVRHVLQKATVITNTLKMIFKLISQKAHILSAPILLLIGNYYLQSNSYDEALHLFRVAHTKVQHQESSIKYLSLTAIARSLQLSGNMNDAEIIMRQVIPWVEVKYGKKHLYTLLSRLVLARTLRKQGTWEEAENIYHLLHTQLPLEDEKFDILQELSLVYFAQQKWKLADEGLGKVLLWRGKKFGKDHSKTIDTTMSLATARFKQKDWKAAAEGYREVLLWRERHLGKDNLKSISAAQDLACTYYQQEQWDAAEAGFRRVLKSYEQKYGKDHGKTISITIDLAFTKYNQKQWKEAEEGFQRVLKSREQRYGRNHLKTIDTVICLADAQFGQEKWEIAEDGYRRALDVKEQQHGKEHIETIQTLVRLANSQYEQGKWEAAEDGYRRALGVREQQHSEKHIDATEALIRLARSQYEQGKWESSENGYRRVLSLREQQYGTDHYATMIALHSLSCALSAQGKWEIAEKTLRKVLAWEGEYPNREDAKTLRLIQEASLANVLISQGKWGEAEQLFRSAMATKEKVKGKDSIIFETIDRYWAEWESS